MSKHDPSEAREPGTRLDPERRERQIAATALAIACMGGLDGVTHTAVAKQAGCARSLVTHYFPEDALRARVVKDAVATEALFLVVEALAGKKTFGVAISEELKERAITSMLREQ